MSWLLLHLDVVQKHTRKTHVLQEHIECQHAITRGFWLCARRSGPLPNRYHSVPISSLRENSVGKLRYQTRAYEIATDSVAIFGTFSVLVQAPNWYRIGTELVPNWYRIGTESVQFSVPSFGTCMYRKKVNFDWSPDRFSLGPKATRANRLSAQFPR